MIKLSIDKTVLYLPSKWAELSQEQMVKVLGWRQLGLKREVYFSLCLQLLLKMPVGFGYQVLYFLMRIDWVAKMVMRKDKLLPAKWKLITRASEVDQFDVLKALNWLETAVVVTKAPDLGLDVEDFKEEYFLRARCHRPDDEGLSFGFEQLIDLIQYYTEYCKTQKVEYLNKLVATMYLRVEGGYEPIYLPYFTGKVEKVSFALKLVAYHWFKQLFEKLVATHKDVFTASEENKTQEDPYGIVGFFYRMAGNPAFGPLDTMKKTPGMQVFDRFQIEMFDFKNKPVKKDDAR